MYASQVREKEPTGTFCMTKVLIGLPPNLVFVFFCFSLDRNRLGRGPVGPRLEPPVPKGSQGGAERAAGAPLRPGLPGLSGFASRGERCY